MSMGRYLAVNTKRQRVELFLKIDVLAKTTQQYSQHINLSKRLNNSRNQGQIGIILYS